MKRWTIGVSLLILTLNASAAMAADDIPSVIKQGMRHEARLKSGSCTVAFTTTRKGVPQARTYEHKFDKRSEKIKDVYDDREVFWTSPTGGMHFYKFQAPNRPAGLNAQFDPSVWPPSFEQSLLSGLMWTKLKSAVQDSNWKTVAATDESDKDHIRFYLVGGVNPLVYMRVSVERDAPYSVESIQVFDSQLRALAQDTVCRYSSIDGLEYPTRIFTYYYDIRAGAGHTPVCTEIREVSNARLNREFTKQELNWGPLPKNTAIEDARFANPLRVVQGDHPLSDTDLVQRAAGRRSNETIVDPGAELPDQDGATSTVPAYRKALAVSMGVLVVGGVGLLMARRRRRARFGDV